MRRNFNMWHEKVPNTDELFIFLEHGKTRGQIMDKYGLTVTEGWHCCKFLKGLPSCISFKKVHLKTEGKPLKKPSFVFTTRYYEIKRIRGIQNDSKLIGQGHPETSF